MKCGKHEVVKDGKCVCEDGFAKTSSNGACEEIVGQAIGAECSDTMTCSDPYPYCANDDSDKYCTKQDCSDTDCPSGYTCEARSDAKYCAKLPSGIGEPCTSNTQCSAYDADECDTFNMKCVLGGCATGKTKCPNTWVCCDLSMFAPGVSFCGAPDQGMCPGKVVTP